jgi:hypothetical protein
MRCAFPPYYDAARQGAIAGAVIAPRGAKKLFERHRPDFHIARQLLLYFPRRAEDVDRMNIVEADPGFPRTAGRDVADAKRINYYFQPAGVCEPTEVEFHPLSLVSPDNAAPGSKGRIFGHRYITA